MAEPKEESAPRSVWVIRGVSLAILIGVIGIGAYLYVITKRSFVNVTLGCEAVAGIDEAGFLYQEHEGDKPYRWTNGRAKLTVPIRRLDSPRSVAVHVRVHQPKGTHLRILANSKELFAGQIPGGDFEKVLSLADVPLGDELTLELNSDSWKPKGTIPEAKDERTLGVDVRSVRLLREEAAPPPPAGS